jgi:hypothetical protein
MYVYVYVYVYDPNIQLRFSPVLFFYADTFGRQEFMLGQSVGGGAPGDGGEGW